MNYVQYESSAFVTKILQLYQGHPFLFSSKSNNNQKNQKNQNSQNSQNNKNNYNMHDGGNKSKALIEISNNIECISFDSIIERHQSMKVI